MPFCSSCGNEVTLDVQFCPKCGKKLEPGLDSSSPSQKDTVARDNSFSTFKPRSRWWYLLPILFGIIGGIIAYFVLKNDDKQLAKNCLWLGIILTIVSFVIGFIVGLLIGITSRSVGLTTITSLVNLKLEI